VLSATSGATGTGAGAELGRGLEEDKTTDALGTERGEDRRQRAAERVAGKEDAGVAGLAQYGVDSGKEQSVGVIGKAEPRSGYDGGSARRH